MGLATLDWIVIASYLALCVALGIFAGGKPGSVSSYFKTEGRIPWWAASFSVVATETSLLTVISIPAVAYHGTFGFLQIVFGYMAGRFLVSRLILPSYFSGEQKTAYTFFKERFGSFYQRMISILFLITRLLADGVRLFAAAIPIKVITGLDYPISIAIIAVLTLAYTYYGGLRSVIWIDVLQMFVYIFGGAYIIWFIGNTMIDPIWPLLAEEGKTVIFTLPDSLHALYATPYNIVTAFIGGMFLSMASHGTDHLMVQRLLACNNLKDAQKAMNWSGIFVFIQFALFLTAGMYLFGFFGGAGIAELGLNHQDEILLKFVHEALPAGMGGLIIAGLFAAAMSTLSSSLSALSSSTIFDVFPKLSERADALMISRMFMLIWTVVFIVFAISFTSTENPIIELGLGIAGFTYGGLLGSFLIGRYTDYNQNTTLAGLGSCIFLMIMIISFTELAWPWYTVTGLLIFYISATTVHKIKSRFL